MRQYLKLIIILLVICSAIYTLYAPLKVSANPSFSPHDPIYIDSRDDWLKPESGVTEGSGTKEDPFIIEGWEITLVPGTGTKYGIRIDEDSAYCVIRNIKINGCIKSIGISCRNSYTKIDNVEISNCVQSDENIYEGFGIVSSSNNFMHVSNSTISGCTIGIRSKNEFINISNNKFVNNGKAIKIGAGDSSILNNKFVNNEIAIFEQQKDAFTDYVGNFSSKIKNNKFANNTNGIEAYFDEYKKYELQLYNNVFLGANRAIEVIFKSSIKFLDLKIKFNEISENEYGIFFNGFYVHEIDYSDIIVNHNNIFENEVAVQVTHYCDFTINAQNNWWGDETGPSGDGPGWGNPIQNYNNLLIYEPWCSGPENQAGLIDTTSPETSITSGPSETITYDDVSFGWTGTDDITPTANLVYSYRLEGYDTSWSPYTTSTSKSYTNLPEGTYTFKVKAKDQAGNVDSTSAGRVFTVGYYTKFPTVAITSPVNGSTVSGIVTIVGTANDTDGTVQSVQVKIDSGSWIIVTGTTSWNYTWDSTTVDNGDCVVQARAYDGQEYSSIDSIMVKVNNEKGGGGGIPGFEMVALIVALGAVMLVKRRRK